MGTGPFFNGYLKPKIVKIGPVMNSGGAAQNNRIFFYNRYNTVRPRTIAPYLNIIFLYVTIVFIFTWPKNFVFGQVLFSSACMCLSVCVSVSLFPNYLKKFLTDLDET